VLVTVSDRKVGQNPVNNLYTSFTADVVSATDYAPFGMQMVGRTFDAAGATAYRYGFNGQEKTPEVSSNSFTAEYWQYDARIGRRWNVDPVVKPYESPYATFGNNPIWNVDPDGSDTTKYLNGRQIVDAIKIGYNVINDAVKSQTFSPRKDYTKTLETAIDNYWNSHSAGLDKNAYNEFRDVVFNYHRGLQEIAFSSATAWERYGQRILNSSIDPISAIKQTDVTINAYNGRSMDLVKMGANVAMGTAVGSVGFGAGQGPKGTQINSQKQQQIVNLGNQKTVLIPKKALDVVEYANANGGAAMQGYKGGRAFLNDGRQGAQVLPKTGANGKPITYREYDVNPFKQGVNRGVERVVIGSDGKSYYTSDHYYTFKPIK
jgi:RHS repeat-associated protein